MYIYWLRKHVLTEDLDAFALRRDTEHYGQWQPPRLADAEAVDRAASMADRFERQFLRLMRCYRDGRKLSASMTVLGGQVNVAEQQIIAGGEQRIIADGVGGDCDDDEAARGTRGCRDLGRSMLI